MGVPATFVNLLKTQNRNCLCKLPPHRPPDSAFIQNKLVAFIHLRTREERIDVFNALREELTKQQ